MSKERIRVSREETSARIIRLFHIQTTYFGLWMDNIYDEHKSKVYGDKERKYWKMWMEMALPIIGSVKL